VGIGPTKVLAKMANRLAKKEPEGWLELNPLIIQQSLEAFPVSKVWGIGPATSAKLEGMGIRTALEFTLMDPFEVKKLFTLVGWKIQQELLGRQQIDIETLSPKENILTSRSFSYPVIELADLEEAVADYATGAAEKLRSQDGVTVLVETSVTTNFFHLDEPQYSRSVLVKLPHPTSFTPDIVGAALRGLKEAFRPGFKYKKAGVTLLAIEASKGLQGSLFFLDNPRLAALQVAVDRMNARHGRGTVSCSPKRRDSSWMMRRDLMSPGYTTRWEDLLKIH